LREEAATRAVARQPDCRDAGAADGVMVGAAVGRGMVDVGAEGADDGVGRAALSEAGDCAGRVFSDD
jgi:hypothetical protein